MSRFTLLARRHGGADVSPCKVRVRARRPLLHPLPDPLAPPFWEFSSFIAAAVERELRGQVLDEYLADCESRKGPVSEEAQQRARQVFDEVFSEEGQWPAAS
ncbi:hypothetical protein [Streptomyces tanashiensis]|uniref:hypothetical protein n=1 Tax=Streptomyces tanashiensis TaxID=67367 RepID=UPI0034073058